MRPLEFVLSKVQSKPRKDGWHDFKCPAHEDKTASACAREDQHGHAQVKCFAGCSTESICSALGIEKKDLFATNGHAPKGDIVYDYTTINGVLYYQVVRKPDKKFLQRKPDGKSGWVYSLEGVKRVPYRLHLLPPAIKEKKTIFICEGEKDVHALESVGQVATCNSGGAGKWEADFARIFQGAIVVIIADKDKPGEDHALDVKEKLGKAPLSVSIVQAKKGKDAFDHLAAGLGVEAFIPFHPGALEVETFSEDFKMVETEHLWDPYFPLSKCVLFDADGGTGKTAVLIGVCAMFSNGLLPVTAEKCEPINSIYLHRGEDQSEELHTVYKANSGKTGSIFYLNNQNLVFNAAGIESLEATIEKCGARLVVVDALYYFIQGLVRDTAKALDVLPVMERLTALATRTGVTIVNIRHTTKGTLDKDASELGMGSVQFRNSHRGQLVARYHPEERGLIIVTDEKGSLLNERGEPFGYRRVGKYGEINWIQDVENPFAKKRIGGSRGPDADQTQLAAETIVAFLETGSKPAQAVVAHVIDKINCSRATIFRAKKLLKIITTGNIWENDPFASGMDKWWAD